MFGNNVLFAPRIEWEVLLTVVEDIKEYATDYEKSYNNMRERIEAEEDFQQVCLLVFITYRYVKPMYPLEE